MNSFHIYLTFDCELKCLGYMIDAHTDWHHPVHSFYCLSNCVFFLGHLNNLTVTLFIVLFVKRCLQSAFVVLCLHMIRKGWFAKVIASFGERVFCNTILQTFSAKHHLLFFSKESHGKMDNQLRLNFLLTPTFVSSPIATFGSSTFDFPPIFICSSSPSTSGSASWISSSDFSVAVVSSFFSFHKRA